MARWANVFVMCIIYICTASNSAINSVRALDDNPTNEKSIRNVCITWECEITVSWLGRSMNSSVNPCDNFYEFTCGHFGKYSPEHEQYNRNIYETANGLLEERLKDIIYGIDKANTSKPFRLAKILYDTCMDSDNLEEIDRSEETVDEFNAALNAWPVVHGSQQRVETMDDADILYALLEIDYKYSSVDPSASLPQITLIPQGLDPEIRKMGFNNEIVQAYYKYMVDMAVISGADRPQAENDLKEALNIEIMLAKSTVSDADKWIHYAGYTRTTVEELVAKYPDLRLREFLSMHLTEGVNDSDEIIVPKDFPSIAKVISEAPKRVMADLIQWYKIDSLASKLKGKPHDRWTEYQNLLRQPKKPPKKWQRCVEIVESYLGLSVRALYQRENSNQKVITEVNEMASLIKETVAEIVQEANWLNGASKTEAVQKINNIVGHFPYREEYNDVEKIEKFYEGLELVEGDFHQSITNIRDFLSNKTHEQDASNQHHSARQDNLLTAGAAYIYDSNIYEVPTTYLTSNIYDVYRPRSLNYGTLGFLIAHEISHSIDTEGILYDSNGNMEEWLSPESKETYYNRAQCIIEQYGNYTVEEIGLRLQAHRNLAENMADNLGAKAAYRAYLKWSSRNEPEPLLPGITYTPEQLFWIGMGNFKCSHYKNLELMYDVLSDVHSPAKFRINGAMANRPEFATDFGCKPGSPMNPVKKCSVW